jgi:transcriptional regulator with GAF, ATPase, and Fis domain
MSSISKLGLPTNLGGVQSAKTTMYAEITAAIQSVKTVAELAKTATALSNYNELIAAVSEVNSKLMDATAVALASQERQSELLNRVADLERELNTVRQRQTLADRYSLHQFPSAGLVYKLKESAGSDEPMHYACPKCADEGGHSKLQIWGKTKLQCPKCTTVFPTEPDKPADTRRRSQGSSYLGR